MYLIREDAYRLLKSHFDELLASLSEQGKFLGDLHGGDDWSFVIKAQALVEGAVTQAVLSHIGDPRLLRIVEAMPLVGDEVSKLALAKDLDLLTSPQRRFVKTMASLRNRLAHRVDQASFTFGDYVASLDRDRRKEWQVSIPWFAQDETSRQTWALISIKSPKAAIHLSTFMLVALLTADGAEKEGRRKLDEMALTTTSKLLSESPDEPAA